MPSFGKKYIFKQLMKETVLAVVAAIRRRQGAG